MIVHTSPPVVASFKFDPGPSKSVAFTKWRPQSIPRGLPNHSPGFSDLGVSENGVYPPNGQYQQGK